MKIPYKKKREYNNLFSSLFFLFYAYSESVKNMQTKWFYLLLICAIGSFLYFLFDKKIYYLTLKEGVLITRKYFGKKIALTEITEIIKENDFCILKTNNSEIKIDLKIIDQGSITTLNTELKKVNFEIT